MRALKSRRSLGWGREELGDEGSKKRENPDWGKDAAVPKHNKQRK
jgi:hypothetical protein